MSVGSFERVEGVSIVRFAGERSPDLTALLEPSLAERHGLVRRTLDEWSNGINRFDKPGEIFIVALVEDATVGMCGLNVDPYEDDPRLGRIRHLYVSPPYRRHGIGQQLVDTCLRHAVGSFDRVRLRTFEPVAARFYEAIGFAPVEEPAATHTRTL